MPSEFNANIELQTQPCLLKWTIQGCKSVICFSISQSLKSSQNLALPSSVAANSCLRSAMPHSQASTLLQWIARCFGAALKNCSCIMSIVSSNDAEEDLMLHSWWAYCCTHACCMYLTSISCSGSGKCTIVCEPAPSKNILKLRLGTACLIKYWGLSLVPCWPLKIGSENMVTVHAGMQSEVKKASSYLLVKRWPGLSRMYYLKTLQYSTQLDRI